LRRCVAEEALVLVAERFGRLEVPAVLDVPGEGKIERAGDVTGDGVDRLGLAAEAWLAADVEHSPLRIVTDAVDLGNVGRRQMPGIGGIRLAWGGRFDRRGYRQRFGQCRTEATVEDLQMLVAGGAQHPPGSRGGVGRVVV